MSIIKTAISTGYSLVARSQPRAHAPGDRKFARSHTASMADGMEKSVPVPDLGSLGRWLRSWIQPCGAIHGFHNHSVWGENPYRCADFYSGHSTFAAPLMMGIAQATRAIPDDRGKALLDCLVRFQIGSLQADGQFDHIGFQLGDRARFGLIHNVVPCVALATIAPQLEEGLRVKVDQTVRNVLAVCDDLYPLEPHDGMTTNQEYCRLWAKLAHMEAFGHDSWDADVRRGLDYLKDAVHIAGVPDIECTATLRNRVDKALIEPAEYYGLMIAPLHLAGQRYESLAYAAQARAIALHVIRSSWIDRREQRRFHRFWLHRESGWKKVCEPMLIGGMGITLAAIEMLSRQESDAEFDAFLGDMDQTYCRYQSGAGFFLAASGWDAEPDIVPASAWQSHDFYHLICRHGIGVDFWDRFFSRDDKAAVVFGKTQVWIEDATHWALHGYASFFGACGLNGRKDQPRFQMTWHVPQEGEPSNSVEYRLGDCPRFARTDTEICHLSGRRDLHVLLASPLSYDGPSPACGNSPQ